MTALFALSALPLNAARVEAQANAVAAQLAGVVEAALGQIKPQAPR